MPETTPIISVRNLVKCYGDVRAVDGVSFDVYAGEILVILMIEDTRGIENLSDILKNVPGIGAVLIGEGDLSQELGYPRQYEHKVVLDAMAQIVGTCKDNNVAVGHPHVNAGNVERILDEGYAFLMAAPVRSTPGLDKGLELAGRKVGEKPSAPALSY